MAIRHAMQNINTQVGVNNNGNNTVITLHVKDLPPLKQEPYSRPLHERLPMAWFAPTDFVYYGTKGSLHDWTDYGKWEYSLIQDRDQLTDAERQELHQLTDGLKTDREKVEAIYRRLEDHPLRSHPLRHWWTTTCTSIQCQQEWLWRLQRTV